MHLSASDPSTVDEILFSWQESIEKQGDDDFIRGEVDTFRIRSKDAPWDLTDLSKALPRRPSYTAEQGLPDYSKVIKDIVAHEKATPAKELTPRFDHELYYSSLKRYQAIESDAEDWGNVLLYGDVVTSTNSLLEK